MKGLLLDFVRVKGGENLILRNNYNCDNVSREFEHEDNNKSLSEKSLKLNTGITFKDF